MPELKKDSVGGTLLVAALVSLVCSSFVASAAVLLKPYQERNQAIHMRRNIVDVAGLLQPGVDVEELFQSIETRIIDLETGAYVEDVDPAQFDEIAAARDPELGVIIPPELDIASVGKRAQYAPVYLVKEDGEIQTIVLPVRGYGLWSTMYGFIALEADGNTIAGLTFYEHGETPGLGDQIAHPSWRSLWQGKRLFDEAGDAKIEVVKGRVPAGDPLEAYRVDGISGATLTGNGVTRLLRYWIGEHGYGPYLRRLREAREP